jgi:Tfp pilus assembly protein PilN
MSASLAAARKRRGVAPPEPPVVAQPSQTQQQSAGLTLPQVIALVDKRLITLEAFMKEQKDKPVQSQVQQSTSVQSLNNDILKTEIVNMAEEFNNRYELLASEIQSIKDIVLKLQSYTMEVNKTLMEERVRILSDVENPSNITIDDEVLEEDV